MTQLKKASEVSEPTEVACPGCGANAVELVDAVSGRHRCGRCGWACRIGRDGKATSWLRIGTAGKRPKRR